MLTMYIVKINIDKFYIEDQVLVFLSESKSLLIAPVSKYNSSGLKVDIISLMLPIEKLKLYKYNKWNLLVGPMLFVCMYSGRPFGKRGPIAVLLVGKNTSPAPHFS